MAVEVNSAKITKITMNIMITSRMMRIMLKKRRQHVFLLLAPRKPSIQTAKKIAKERKKEGYSIV